MKLVFAVFFIWCAFVVGRAYESRAPLQKGVHIVSGTAADLTSKASRVIQAIAQ